MSMAFSQGTGWLKCTALLCVLIHILPGKLPHLPLLHALTIQFHLLDHAPD